MTSDVQTSSAIPEEWLSAYLDDELSQEERDQVETALEASPPLRMQLDELRQVSDLLRGLPNPQLAAGFAKSLPLDPPVRRSAGLSWKFGMTAGSLVAASLVAGVLWIQTETARAPEMWIAASKEADRSGAFDEAVAASSVAAPAMETEELADGFASSGVAPDAGLSSVTIGRLDSIMGRDGIFRSASVPRSGDLIPLLESNDENVAVVEWVVVDVDEAFGQLQLTLASMGVPPAEKSDAIDARGERFLAVFVEADESVMQSVMAASARQRLPVQQQLVKNSFADADDLNAYGPLVAQMETDANAKMRSRVEDSAAPARAATPRAANAASNPPQLAQNVTDRGADAPQLTESMRIQEGQQTRRSVPDGSQIRAAEDLPKERQSGIPSDGAARFSVNDPARPPAPLATPSAGENGPFSYGATTRPEGAATFGINYQMPLQLTQESVDRIAANNSLTQPDAVGEEETPKSQRLLIVFKPAE